MKAYRLKHLPTGLYYIPSRDVKITGKWADGSEWWEFVKSNLSKTGKCYVRKPSLKQIGSGIYNHLKTKELLVQDRLGVNYRYSFYRISGIDPVIESEWEIEEV